MKIHLRIMQCNIVVIHVGSLNTFSNDFYQSHICNTPKRLPALLEGIAPCRRETAADRIAYTTRLCRRKRAARPAGSSGSGVIHGRIYEILSISEIKKKKKNNTYR